MVCVDIAISNGCHDDCQAFEEPLDYIGCIQVAGRFPETKGRRRVGRVEANTKGDSTGVVRGKDRPEKRSSTPQWVDDDCRQQGADKMPPRGSEGNNTNGIPQAVRRGKCPQ